MPFSIKQELLDKIAATDDENLLQHLKDEMAYFKGEKNVLDELSANDLEELQTLLKEPFGHETESYEDFKKATERWRTR